MLCALAAGLMASMKQGDLSNWSLSPDEFADLASSLTNFFSQSGRGGSERNAPYSQNSISGEWADDGLVL